MGEICIQGNFSHNGLCYLCCLSYVCQQLCLVTYLGLLVRPVRLVLLVRQGRLGLLVRLDHLDCLVGARRLANLTRLGWLQQVGMCSLS